MLKTIKAKLRTNKYAVKTYSIFKKILVFPFKFTSLNDLQLDKAPLIDLLNWSKISLLKKVRPYTKNGYPRLANVYDLAREVEKKNLPGAFIECGVYKGGCCAIFGAIADRYGNRRKTWYLDSFEGMPKTPSVHDGSGTEEITGEVLRASPKDVEELIFGKLNLPRDKNIIVKGWFEEVLPKIKSDVGQIAVIRLDADWYEATKLILEELFDQVVSGGYLIFDDYARWVGSRKAVDEFLEARGLKPKMQFIGSVNNAYGRSLAPMFFCKD